MVGARGDIILERRGIKIPANEFYPNEIRNLFLIKFMDRKVMGAKGGKGRHSEREKTCVCLFVCLFD